MKQLNIKVLTLGCILFATTIVGAQTNLLLNGQADYKTEHWNVKYNTTVEEFNGDKVFVLRNDGNLQQWFQLKDEAIGKYALLIGRVSSQRANVDGKTTPNTPYLFVATLVPKIVIGEGQILPDDAKGENDWHTIYAIHQLPKEEFSGFLKCSLHQRNSRKGENVPNEGSAVRFDNLGLYLFDTEEDALKFAKAYK
ncbi:MAG: hypothetical protein ABI686_04085 [Acidobacteriota bacterium]